MGTIFDDPYFPEQPMLRTKTTEQIPVCTRHTSTAKIKERGTGDAK